MATIFDRLNQELEQFGRKAQTALDEGKLQIELLRLRRQRDNAAADLGLLVHRRERGHEVDQRRVDALLLRLDDVEAAISGTERRLADLRGERTSVSREPAPASAQQADAEIVDS